MCSNKKGCTYITYYQQDGKKREKYSTKKNFKLMNYPYEKQYERKSPSTQQYTDKKQSYSFAIIVEKYKSTKHTTLKKV